MLPKPDHLQSEFGAQFQDQSIAEVYTKRPPYPAETFDILLSLIHDESATVLELGCATHSTNRKFQPYELLQALTTRQLFTLEQRVQTTPVPFTQSVADYVESFHNRNGFSRERMGDSAAVFDEQVTALVTPYSVDNMLSFNLSPDIAWGMPVG